MTPSTKKAFDNIIDVIACTDCGPDLINTKCFIEELDRQAELGDKPSQEILNVVLRFSKLLDIATGKLKQPE